jgi:hypothetical protein
LITELATAKQRNRELQKKVQVLERRLGAHGSSFGPALLDQHPLVIELRSHIAQVELDIVEKDRTIARFKTMSTSCGKPTGLWFVNTASHVDR